VDKTTIAKGVQLILEGLGVDKSDHNFFDTPQRYARALEEIFAPPLNHTTTFEESYADFILVREHEIHTLCPHHLLPMRMLVSLAYIPNGRVLGLSKLVRIMQKANSGPIMQERFTYAVKDILEESLEQEVDGICVLVEGWHGCMSMRGVRSSASTITMASSGHFADDDRMLDRFLSLVRGK
jgi:GTP cyclohydrolase I